MSNSHQPSQRHSKEERDTRVINNIFSEVYEADRFSNSHSKSKPTTRNTNQGDNNNSFRRPSPSSDHLRQDPHFLSAVRESVHFAQPSSTSNPTSGTIDSSYTQSSSGPYTQQPQTSGMGIKRSTSPFDDKYAAGLNSESSAGTKGHALGPVLSVPNAMGAMEMVGQASGESNGVVGKERVRFERPKPSGPTRTSSSSNNPLATIPRLDRDQSSSSTSTMLDPSSTSTSTIRLVAPVEKRPSKHADLIDKWDGSGVGKSMWHHSGPYDAAAPSRNDARERGAERAPMAVFDPRKGSRVTELDGKALQAKEAVDQAGMAGTAGVPGSTGQPGVAARPVHERFRSGSITRVMNSGEPKVSPGLEQEVVLPSLTSGNLNQQYAGAISMTARPNRPGRKNSTHSPITGVYGSLQEEYSSSVPTSGGGYFDGSSPTKASGSAGVMAASPGGKRISTGGAMSASAAEDEERRMRQKERENKRRALQAAWGIDEPEPYEDFGGYAQGDNESVTLNDTNDPVMLSSTPPVDGSRSPGKSGLSLGGLMRSTSRSQAGGYSKYTPSPAAANGESAEYFTAKPIGETDGTISPGAGGLNGSGGAKGVKRTRSLMQRIRAMRDNPNVPVAPDAPLPRAGSPASGGRAGRQSPWSEDTMGIMAEGQAVPSGTPGHHSSGGHTPTPPTLQLGQPDSGVRRKSSFLGRNRTNRTGTSNSAPMTPNETTEEILLSADTSLASPGIGGGRRASSPPARQKGAGMGRDKALPPPPAPVLLEFDQTFGDMTLKPPTEGGGVQRKTSLMKKLKARIG